MYPASENRGTIVLAIGSSEIGGAQRVLSTTIRELLERQHHLVVALPEGPLFEILKSYEIELKMVDFTSPKCVSAIAALLGRADTYVVNSHLTRCSLMFAVVNLFYRKPLCCSLHNSIIHERLGRLQRLFYPLLYWCLYRICDGIIVNSEQNREHFVQVAGMKPECVKVIPNGIDIDEFSGMVEPKCTNRKFQIGCVGRLSIEKGQTYLIDALGLLRNMDYECVVVGDGPMRAELERKVLNSGLQERVKFAGFQMEVAPLMRLMDVVVVPSLNEVFPIAILEAFALRKVVIASDVGGIPELVIDMKTGLLFPVRDSSALAEKILFVYDHREEARAMAINAYAYCREKFTGAIMADNIIRYYESVVTARSC